MSQSWSFETRQIHAGQEPDSATGARALPIYQTTSYVFNDTDHAANLFALKEFGNIYTRIMNPTTDVVEKRLASLEGGVGGLLTASGQSAELLALLNVAETGATSWPARSLYGGTYNLLHYTFPKLGIEVSFVDDPDDLESWRSAVRPNTKAFFAETISNPKQDILDIENVADLAHEVGVPLIVDNTVATPYLIRPLEWGADVVVHSTTKYLGGHGTAIGGAIIDAGTVRLRRGPGEVPAVQRAGPELPRAALRAGPRGRQRARRQPGLHPQGAGAAAPRPRSGRRAVQLVPAGPGDRDPQPADGAARRQRRAGGRVADRSRRGGERRATPGLKTSQWYDLARSTRRWVPAPCWPSRSPVGWRPASGSSNALELHSHVANIGDVRSLVIHPASTTHSQLSEAEQLSTGVTPGLVRLAVGIENIDDILADLDAGFRAAKEA